MSRHIKKRYTGKVTIMDARAILIPPNPPPWERGSGKVLSIKPKMRIIKLKAVT